MLENFVLFEFPNSDRKGTWRMPWIHSLLQCLTIQSTFLISMITREKSLNFNQVRLENKPLSHLFTDFCYFCKLFYCSNTDTLMANFPMIFQNSHYMGIQRGSKFIERNSQGHSISVSDFTRIKLNGSRPGLIASRSGRAKNLNFGRIRWKSVR